MFDYLRFRFTLWLIDRADSKVDRKHRAIIKKARARNASREEIDALEYEHALDGIDAADAIKKLHSRYYSRQAARMLIPLPDLMDKGMWEHESPNRIHLTEQGIMHVRSMIRAERKARLEMFLMWVPGVVGILGTLIGLVAVLAGKK